MKIPTKEELESLYNECNETYFWGKLGKCSFMYFTKGNSTLGWYNARTDKKGRPADRIWFGTCVDWTEEQIRRIMIHEMVHMYNHRIEKRRWTGILGHGRCFRKHQRRIKRDFGIDIKKLNDYVFLNKDHYPKTWEKVLLWIFDR